MKSSRPISSFLNVSTIPGIAGGSINLFVRDRIPREVQHFASRSGRPHANSVLLRARASKSLNMHRRPPILCHVQQSTRGELYQGGVVAGGKSPPPRKMSTTFSLFGRKKRFTHRGPLVCHRHSTLRNICRTGSRRFLG
jgi:hypothetical protein